MDVNQRDARAPYYLGNLLFDWQPEESVGFWEKSAALDPSFAIVQRNLAVAWSQRRAGNPIEKAVAALEKAVAADRKYALHFYELDRAYEAVGTAPETRLALLEKNHGVVDDRDDALNREIGLKVATGNYDDAIRLMTGRRFAVWEGGNLNVADSWVEAHLLRAQRHIDGRRFREALNDLEAAAKIPDNLPSERAAGRIAEIGYWKGVAHAALGDAAPARTQWEQAATAAAGPGGGRRGGAGLSVQSYYRALALQKLGRSGEAEPVLRALVESAQRAVEQAGTGPAAGSAIDAVLTHRDRLAAAHFAAALGHSGLNQAEASRGALKLALQANPAHAGARALAAR
jgi:tetratricopeptide (TPR) repeat protein